MNKEKKDEEYASDAQSRKDNDYNGGNENNGSPILSQYENLINAKANTNIKAK